MIINQVDNELKDIAGFIDHGKDKDLRMIYLGWLYEGEKAYIEIYSQKSNKTIAKFKEK